MPSPGPQAIVGELEWCGISRCKSSRTAAPDTGATTHIVYADANDCVPPEAVAEGRLGGHAITNGPLDRDAALRVCMDLDDDSLSWVCNSLLVDRAGVMEDVLQAWSKQLTMVEDMMAKRAEQMTVLDASSEQCFKEDYPKSVDGALALHVTNGLAEEKSRTKQINGLTKQLANVEIDKSRDLMDDGEINYLHDVFANRDKKWHGLPPDMRVPCIQLWTTMSYCSEAEPSCEIAIVRTGDVSKRSTACYATKDMSAKAGEKYVAASGKVVFEPGERMSYLTIQTINDTNWQATLEFEVHLIAKGLENAQLEEALSVCRIKIIDDDCFPTNRFQKEIMSGGLDSISKPLLMLEYFKMNAHNPVVRRGLIKTLIADQVENVYFVVALFLDLWMVDYVLCENCDKDGVTGKLVLIMLLRVFPFALVHYLKFRAVYSKIGGTSRMTLQANLLRKYLNFDEGSLSQVDESRLLMAMTRDAFDLVHNAFAMIPKLTAAISRLLLLVLYQYCTPLLLGEQMGSVGENVVRLAPGLIFPLLMTAFLYHRNPITVQALEKQKNLQNEMMFHTKRTIECFDLIRDFRKRGAYVVMFESKIKAFNSAYTCCSGIVTNNNQFAPWVSLLVVAFYTLLGGLGVADGKLALGGFLNTLAVYGAFGELWGQVYEVLLDMQNSFEALTTMVKYMNLPTELLHRKKHYDTNHEWLCSAFENALKEKRWADIDPVDKMCIELRDLSFMYRSKGLIKGVLKSSTAQFVQGGLYALVGPPSQGKGTILKLLGEVLLPFYPEHTRNSDGGGGELMTPSHLSMLHVSKDPCFVQGSLFYNLTFGCEDSNDSRMDRVVRICKKLGLQDHIIETVKDQGMVDCDWLHMLSSTELALLHIARALICNPEVVCIHKPALFLNTEMSDNMYMVLKDFVTNRGLEEPEEEFYHRRPRTCIISARRIAGPAAEVADAVYHVSADEGLVLIKDHRGFRGTSEDHRFHCEMA